MCSLDDCEIFAAYETTERRARKPHKCDGCGRENRDQFKKFAEEMTALQDGHKDRSARLKERVAAAGFDPSGLRRFVAWKRRDAQKRAEQDAIDQQCRYLAGESDTPATLPIGCELHRAINCFRRNMTVRQAAEELGVSVGKAQKLRGLARMFDDVHSSVNMNAQPKIDVITPHHPETGEVIEEKDDDGRISEGTGGGNEQARGGNREDDGTVRRNPASRPAEQLPDTAHGHAAVSRAVDGQLSVERPHAPVLTGTSSTESCGGVESRHARPVEREHVASAPAAKIGETGETGNAPSQAGVAPGPQDAVPASDAGNAGGHDARVVAPEPEVARVALPATDPADDDLAFPPHLDRRQGASA